MTDWDILCATKNRHKKALARLEALKTARNIVNEYTFMFDREPTIAGLLSFLNDETNRASQIGITNDTTIENI